jgi:hypothetical protein
VIEVGTGGNKAADLETLIEIGKRIPDDEKINASTQ